MEWTWTTVGAELVDRVGGREAVELAIGGLDWKERDEFDTGFSQSYALNAVIGEFGIPEVERLAETVVSDRDGDAGYGLYAVEARYANGLARIFMLDTGTAVTVLCHELVEAAATV